VGVIGHIERPGGRSPREWLVSMDARRLALACCRFAG
jgi:hypothetical protein